MYKQHLSKCCCDRGYGSSDSGDSAVHSWFFRVRVSRNALGAASGGEKHWDSQWGVTTGFSWVSTGASRAWLA